MSLLLSASCKIVKSNALPVLERVRTLSVCSLIIAERLSAIILHSSNITTVSFEKKDNGSSVTVGSTGIKNCNSSPVSPSSIFSVSSETILLASSFTSKVLNFDSDSLSLVFIPSASSFPIIASVADITVTFATVFLFSLSPPTYSVTVSISSPKKSIL